MNPLGVFLPPTIPGKAFVRLDVFPTFPGSEAIVFGIRFILAERGGLSQRKGLVAGLQSKLFSVELAG